MLLVETMYEYSIKNVVRIVDGDTVDVEIDLGFSLTKKERIRLAGIDTPETRTRNDEEKKLGIDAKEYLTMRLDSCENLIVKTEKDGKYGRMLGWLFDGNKTINSDMVDLGYAWVYGGGSKSNDLKELKEKRGIFIDNNEK
jgi:micrococcal nuclease